MRQPYRKIFSCFVLFIHHVTSPLTVAVILSLPRMQMAAAFLCVWPVNVFARMITGSLLAPKHHGLLTIFFYVKPTMRLWGAATLFWDKSFQLLSKNCIGIIKISFYFHGFSQESLWSTLTCIIQTWVEQSLFWTQAVNRVCSWTLNERFTLIYADYI